MLRIQTLKLLTINTTTTTIRSTRCLSIASTTTLHKPFFPPPPRPAPTMTKRKRAAVIKAEASMATLAALPEGSTTSEEQEHIGDEFAPEEEEEGSDEFDPEPATATKTTKGKGKRASQKSDKPAPKKKKQKPAIDRKTFIKTMNKDGTMITREPQVNSTHLPLPWKGRIGYVLRLLLPAPPPPPSPSQRANRHRTIRPA